MTYVTDDIRNLFDNHVLELIQEGKITGYYLREPGTRNCLVLLTFSPEGITIAGDLTPETNGSVSTYGYGLDWFSRQSSEGYLCEKFLTQRWLPELAAAELRDPGGWFREQVVDDNQMIELKLLANSLEVGECGAFESIERLDDIGIECQDVPGFGYDPKEASVLCAIQQTFRRLYWAGKDTKGKTR